MIRVANVVHESTKLYVTQTRFLAMFLPLSIQNERKRERGVPERGDREGGREKQIDKSVPQGRRQG